MPISRAELVSSIFSQDITWLITWLIHKHRDTASLTELLLQNSDEHFDSLKYKTYRNKQNIYWSAVLPFWGQNSLQVDLSTLPWIMSVYWKNNNNHDALKGRKNVTRLFPGSQSEWKYRCKNVLRRTEAEGLAPSKHQLFSVKPEMWKCLSAVSNHQSDPDSSSELAGVDASSSSSSEACDR